MAKLRFFLAVFPTGARRNAYDHAKVRLVLPWCRPNGSMQPYGIYMGLIVVPMSLLWGQGCAIKLLGPIGRASLC